MCYAIQPIDEHLGWANGSSLASQDNEGRLKSVLGVMVVGENSATDAPYHWAMTPHQRCERSLVLVLDKTPDQLTVG